MVVAADADKVFREEEEEEEKKKENAVVVAGADRVSREEEDSIVNCIKIGRCRGPVRRRSVLGLKILR